MRINSLSSYLRRLRSQGQKKRLKLKRKKARTVAEVSFSDDHDYDEESRLIQTKSKAEKFCDGLGVTEMMKKRKKKVDAAEAEAVAAKKSKSSSGADAVEVVVFESYKKKPKKIVEGGKEEGDDGEKTVKPFNFKKARHEVFKFGIAGMDLNAKTSAKVAHALSLGAKPEKGKKTNYKQLMEEKKKEKDDKELERLHGSERFRLRTNFSASAKGREAKKKRDPNAVRGFDAQVGTYRDGVQFVNKKLFNKK